MIELFIVIIVLLALVFIIVLYGYFNGGVEGMLEKEREFNTIEATDKVEVTVFIDFFHQIKRVDSLYFNERSQTLQLKKNNHLSDPFKWAEIKKVQFQINDEVIFTSSRIDKFDELNEALSAQDLEDKELNLTLSVETTDHVIAFESPERSLSVVETLRNWESLML